MSDKWAQGPQTFLGVYSHGFPNLFIIAGAQSVSVLTNFFTAITDHVLHISKTIQFMSKNSIAAGTGNSNAGNNNNEVSNKNETVMFDNENDI